jgi:mandelate racemase
MAKADFPIPGTHQTTTISKVCCRAVAVPLALPYRSAKGILNWVPFVFTEAVTQDGAIGRSCIFVSSEWFLRPIVALIRSCGETMLHRSASPQQHSATLRRRLGIWGTEGLAAAAASAIDIALWDACACQSGVPLAQVLGGTPRDAKVYGGIGLDGVASAVAQAERLFERGHTAVKLKLGYPSVEEDLAVIRAVRCAGGPRIAIMVDYNQSLTVDEAIARCGRLDEEGLTWIEEPVSALDLDGHALVAQQTRTPIQSGENWWTTRQISAAIQCGASDEIMLDPAKIGGVSGWLAASSVITPTGLVVSSHLYPTLCAQLLSVTPNAGWLEFSDWWRPLTTHDLIVTDGWLRIAGEAWTRSSWDMSSIERYTLT